MRASGLPHRWAQFRRTLSDPMPLSEYSKPTQNLFWRVQRLYLVAALPTVALIVTAFVVAKPDGTFKPGPIATTVLVVFALLNIPAFIALWRSVKRFRAAGYAERRHSTEFPPSAP